MAETTNQKMTIQYDNLCETLNKRCYGNREGAMKTSLGWDCDGLNFVLLKIYFDDLIPLVPVNVTIFGNRVLKGVIKLR